VVKGEMILPGEPEGKKSNAIMFGVRMKKASGICIKYYMVFFSFGNNVYVFGRLNGAAGDFEFLASHATGWRYDCWTMVESIIAQNDLKYFLVIEEKIFKVRDDDIERGYRKTHLIDVDAGIIRSRRETGTK
jgi:hypothetical protein